MNGDSIEKLRSIWAHIPPGEARGEILPKEEIIKKFLNLFHPGNFFYNIFNTRTAVLEYVSPEVNQVLGYESEEMDLSFVMSLIHPEDMPYYIHHEKCATEFFRDLPVEKRSRYKFSHDYRMLHQSGAYTRILIQVIPVSFFSEGGARTLCVFTDISHLKPQGEPRLSFIGLEGEPSYFNVEPGGPIKEVPRLFTKREQEILKLTVQGLTGKEIADMLHISRYTVDTHRKNILAKSGCTRVNELIAKAVTEGLV